MAGIRRIGASSGLGPITKLHAFSVNQKGQLVYTTQELTAETSINTQDENGNERFDQYHVGPASMRYAFNDRGKFVIKVDE
jgi:hypothetical protein